MSADVPPVVRERRGNVLVITLNRPDVRNAINLPMARLIAAALDEFDGDPELRVGVLTGAGRGFSSGMDLAAFVEDGEPIIEGRGFAGIVERAAEKPLIAAIEGFAVAGGLEVALSCDLLVAAADARLGLAEVRRGLVASGGGLVRLSRRIPHHVAMELGLSGNLVPAERLYQAGLINRLAAPGGALTAALELAEIVASNGPLAVAATKRIVDAAPDWTMAESWSRAAELARVANDSEDAIEGSNAFLEKREPRWSGE